MDFSNSIICIGYPSTELIHTEFATDLLNLATQSSQHVRCGLTNVMSSNISENRNVIVKNARMLGATHILFIDTDQKFPAHGLVKLLSYDKDIVCATASRRKGSNRTPIGIPMDVSSLTPYQKLVPMRIVGFPFMLIKMSVFDKLEKPYFAQPPRKSTSITTGISEVVGEDEYFCAAAIAAKFDIWCDMELSMEIGHIGETVYYIEQNKALAHSTDKIDIALGSYEAKHREQGGIGE